MRGPAAFALSAAAIAWGGALLVAAVLAPVYSSRATATEVNGPWVVLPAAIPLVLAAFVFARLRSECSRGRGRTMAWACIGVLALLSFVGVSVGGIFVLPALALLAAAAAITPSAVSPR